ncbi:MAG: radical SAM protein [Lachnospiraceae bacterium]|nr:radical SAM protein [Lachnospiraceae bacterium]
MSECRICPRACGADREAGNIGFCGTPEDIFVSRAALHMWEEPCISGKNGSGTVFFSGCNLHCCFCQNYDISRGSQGKKITVERLAEIFLELQARQANNINLVTPTHYAFAIIPAIELAKNKGLTLPVVYNCGGYESVDTIKRLADYVDIWMPDMKYKSAELSARYSNAADYFERASKALEEMVRSTEAKGGMAFSEDKPEEMIMTRGVIVRHMTLPGATADSKRILRYLHESYGDRIYISIMSQYTPMPHIMNTDKFPELKRKVDPAEYGRLVDFAERIGIENAFIQEGEVAEESFIPQFDCSGV